MTKLEKIAREKRQGCLSSRGSRQSIDIPLASNSRHLGGRGKRIGKVTVFRGIMTIGGGVPRKPEQEKVICDTPRCAPRNYVMGTRGLRSRRVICRSVKGVLRRKRIERLLRAAKPSESFRVLAHHGRNSLSLSGGPRSSPKRTMIVERISFSMSACRRLRITSIFISLVSTRRKSVAVGRDNPIARYRDRRSSTLKLAKQCVAGSLSFAVVKMK